MNTSSSSKILFIIIIIFLLSKLSISSTLYFPYPTATTLNNGNIFIIYKYGVVICDKNITNVIKYSYNFTESEEISTEAKLSKVSISKFDDGYIVSIIIDKLYIFDCNGNLRQRYNTIDDKDVPYYTLTAHKTDSNSYHYYLFGFVYQNRLNLYYYKYDPTQTKNTITASIENYYQKYYYNEGSFDTFNIQDNSINCQILAYNTSEEVIVCFYEIYLYSKYILFISYFNFNGNSLDFYKSYEYDFSDTLDYIKSSSIPDNSKILSCYYLNTSTAQCLIHELNEDTIDIFTYDVKCLKQIYGLKVEYISEKGVFAFSCLNEENGIQIYMFNKNLTQPEDEIYILSECEIYGYSLLFSSNINNYILLSDANCSGIENPIEYLILKISDSKEKKEEEKEKEKIIENNECNELEKCELCNEESISKNLCLKCNNKKGYYYFNNIRLESTNDKYIDCVNEETKPSNFYLNKEEQEYRICYETCSKCDYGGDGNDNNCTLCEKKYIFKPDYPGSKNCVIQCEYYYYYTIYDQYKCTDDSQCPEDYNLLIKEKGKCIDNCRKDNIYKYQYNGKCLEICPNDTIYDNNDYICKDIILNKCKLSEDKFTSLSENITENDIELLVKNFAKEYGYTTNHVSIFKNNIYSITLYKNGDCISELSLEVPEVDFGECYEKIQNDYKTNNDLIIAIITKNIEGINYPKMVYYSMYEPTIGKKIKTDDICQDDIIIVQENLYLKLDNIEKDIDSLIYLTEQNIDIFNISNEFYNDICYHFNSPVSKDTSLKDRILFYYPNITLCEDGCQIKGVNLTTFKAKCECKLNNLMHNNLLEKNVLLKSSLDEIDSFISETNIEVMKCYKDIFVPSYWFTNVGVYMILALLFTQLALTIISFNRSTFIIKKYIFDITDNYLSYLLIQQFDPQNNNKDSLVLNNNDNVKCSPVKRKREKKIEENENEIIIRKYRKARTKLDKNDMKTIIHKKRYTALTNYQPTKKDNVIHNDFENNFSDNNYKQSLNRLFINSNEHINNHNKLSNKFNHEKHHKRLITKDLIKNMQQYLCTDIDDLDYDDAIKKDKRKFCVYLCGKLKANQIILNTFCVLDHLRPRTIKIMLFILEIDLYLFVNGLFFNEEYISEIFHSASPENFFAFIPRSLNRFFYTTLVGVIIGYVIDFFFIEEKKIKGIFKREKDSKIILRYEISQVIKDVQKRNKWFIILSFFIIFLTLYYIFCFNNIYPHMRNEWIKSSIIIIFVRQLLSIFVCLLESIIRYISFKCKSEKIFKMSLLLS